MIYYGVVVEGKLMFDYVHMLSGQRDWIWIVSLENNLFWWEFNMCGEILLKKEDINYYMKILESVGI